MMQFRFAIALLLTFLTSTVACHAAVATDDSVCNNALSAKLKLPIYVWSNPGRPARGTIVAIHGLTFYGEAYEHLAQHLSGNGFRFVAVDMRGFGRWRSESKFGGDGRIHFGESLEDVIQVVRAIKEDYPYEKVYLAGESLGANMALRIVSLHPELCDGAILSSLGYKFKFHPTARLIGDVAKGIRHPRSKMNLTPYITPYLSNDPVVTADCLNDSKINRTLSPVELLKARRTNLEARRDVSRIPPTFPILVVAGLQDGVFNNKALPTFLRKFGTQRLDVKIWEDEGHLLLEHQVVHPQITMAIDEWLTRNEQLGQVAKSPTADTTRRN